jgi:hypothetical protein
MSVLSRPTPVLLAMALIGITAAYSQVDQSLGYKSVNAAREAVAKIEGVRVRSENGWLIIEDALSKTVWSFVGEAHPAYPSVVRRKVVSHGESVSIESRIFCEARNEAACKQLAQEFAALDRRTKENLSE